MTDLCDLLEPYAPLAVLSVDQDSYYSSWSGQLLRLCEVLERMNVQSDALDADLIVISANNLRKLLSSLRHYNLSIFDVPQG